MRLSPLCERIVRESFVAQAEHYASVGSTNDLARQRAAEGAGPLPLLIAADEQTAGRGRGTNRWWTGPGSLAVSLLFDSGELGFAPDRSPLVALATAVAVARAVAPRLPSHRPGIHWPNDVFVAGRKLAGILVEGLANQRLVVGIGLNVNNSLCEAPQQLRDKATTLLELTGVLHDRTQVLLDLLEHLARGLALLRSAPEQLAAEADQLCLQRGQVLAVQLGQRLMRGRCEGIAPDGALMLSTPEGPERVYSGVLSEAACSDA